MTKEIFGSVLITGAGGDIGRACALELGRRGWSLIITEHPSAADALGTTMTMCVSAGFTVLSELFDVTSEVETSDALERVRTSAGVPTALLNNAGYQGAVSPVQSYPLDDARKVFEVNILGVMNMLTIFGAAMVAAGTGGSIVNTASMAGVGGAPNMPAYSASKAAVIGLTKSAAKDLAPAGIRVNAVSPAFIGPGRMWDRQVALQAEAASQYYATDADEVAKQMIGTVPLRRYGSTTEVATVVAFLLSEDASYLTGVNIEISGGSN